MFGNALVGQVKAGKVGPFFRSRRRVRRRLATSLLPRLPRKAVGSICFCNTKYAPRGTPILQQTVTSDLPIVKGVGTGSSVLTTTHKLYKRRTNVTYVLNANSGSYFCGNRRVVDGVSPLKFVLNSRKDNTMLNGLLMNSMLGGRLPSAVGRTFLGRFSLAIPRVVSQICHRPFPGHFLTDLSPFLTRRLSRPTVHALILGDFVTFLHEGMVRCSCGRCPTRFVNSITRYCGSVLRRTTRRAKVRINGVLRDPVRKLVRCRRGWFLCLRLVNGRRFMLYEWPGGRHFAVA